MLLRDLSQRRHLLAAQATVLHEQREMAVAVHAVVPAIAVAGRSESERLRPRELDIGAALDLGAENIQPAILNGVFEPRVLTVFPIPPVALHGDHRFGDR